jgi:hypothetical protein
MYEDLKSLSTWLCWGQVFSFVLKSIEDGCQVDLIYTDFSKGFEKMRHRLLLDKMSTDVEPSHCQWLGS